ncbi:MAG: RNA polymerase sigma factor [Cyclobacteriaceae bacterium]
MRETEEELLRGCREGRRSAQHELYQRYAKAMYAICLRYTKATAEAEDVLQEAFVKVFSKMDSFKGESTVGYWIKRIVINTALNHQRSKLYLYPMVDVEEMNDRSGTETTISNYSYQELLEMITSLPDGSQVIFNLYAIEGYKHQEIAKMLGISEGTSKSQYARAKQLLQKKLESHERVNYGRV